MAPASGSPPVTTGPLRPFRPGGAPATFRAMLRVSALALPALLIAAPAWAGSDAPPAPFPIEEAAVVHLSAEGLRALGDAIRNVLPARIEAIGLSGEVDCDENEPGVLSYAAEDIVVHISGDDVAITPSAGRLDLSIDMTLYSDPAEITVVGSCVLDLDEACTLSLQPTALHAEVGLEIELQDGVLNASVAAIEITHGNFGSPVEPGCLLGDALTTMQGYGVDLIGTVLDQVLGEQLAELESQLQATLDSFSQSLAIEQDLELMGAILSVRFEANELEIDDTGLRLGFGASFGTPAYGSCIPHGPGYVMTAHDLPPMTGLLPGTDAPYHVGIVLHGDAIGQALFAAWQGGLLCLRVADLVDLDITTDYLSLVEEELVEATWPDPVSLDLRVSAAEPPRLLLLDPPRLQAELGLDVYGPELDRTTRFWRNGLSADAGIDVLLDEGQLVIDLDFDLQNDLGVSVAYNEWLPMAIPEGFGSLVPDLMGQALDLDALLPSFAMPSFSGLTLHALDVRPVGDPADHLGVFGWVDPTQVQPLPLEPIDLGGVGCGDTGDGGGITVPGCEDGLAGCGGESTGCGEDGGCGGCGEDGGSCGSGGCGVGGANGRALTLLGATLLLVRRRRR